MPLASESHLAYLNLLPAPLALRPHPCFLQFVPFLAAHDSDQPPCTACQLTRRRALPCPLHPRHSPRLCVSAIVDPRSRCAATSQSRSYTRCEWRDERAGGGYSTSYNARTRCHCRFTRATKCSSDLGRDRILYEQHGVQDEMRMKLQMAWTPRQRQTTQKKKRVEADIGSQAKQRVSEQTAYDISKKSTRGPVRVWQGRPACVG